MIISVDSYSNNFHSRKNCKNRQKMSTHSSCPPIAQRRTTKEVVNRKNIFVLFEAAMRMYHNIISSTKYLVVATTYKPTIYSWYFSQLSEHLLFHKQNKLNHIGYNFPRHLNRAFANLGTMWSFLWKWMVLSLVSMLFYRTYKSWNIQIHVHQNICLLERR